MLSGSKSGGRGLQIQAEESLGGATSAWPEGWLSLGRLHLAWQALADLMDLGLPAASAGAGATPRALIACPRRGSTPDGAWVGAFGACVQPSAELGARRPAAEGPCIAFPSLSYRSRSVLTWAPAQYARKQYRRPLPGAGRPSAAHLLLRPSQRIHGNESSFRL